MDEEKTEESTQKDTGEGVQSKADKKVEALNADTERINTAIAENENAKARQKLSGVTEAGQQPVKPKEETDTEYKDRVMRGEV